MRKHTTKWAIYHAQIHLSLKYRDPLTQFPVFAYLSTDQRIKKLWAQNRVIVTFS